ncbi:MAG: hypothetical protein WCR67_01465 [Bacilli bacterium]
MKDFILLVKAVSASSMSVSRKKNGKTIKSRSFSVSQIIATLFLALIFTIEMARGLLELVRVGASQSLIFSFLEMVFAGFFVFALFISISFTPSVFFQSNNDAFISLPIKGEQLFLARLVLSIYLNFIYGGMLILASSITACVILGLPFYSYFIAILFSLTMVLLISCLSFGIINLFSGFIDFKNNHTGAMIFNILTAFIGGVGIVVSSMVSTSFSNLTEIENIGEVISLMNQCLSYTVFMNWSGIVFVKSLLLAVPSDAWFILIHVLLVIFICFLVLFVSRRTYISHLGMHQYKKKKKLTEDQLKEKIAKSFANRKADSIFIKREFSNYQAEPLIIVTSFIYPFAMGITLLITLFFGVNGGGFTDVEGLVQIMAPCFFAFSLFNPSFSFCAMSLEKKNFGLLKTYPISTKKMVLQKIVPSLVLMIPLYIVFLIGYSLVIPFSVSGLINNALTGLGFASLSVTMTFYLGVIFVNFNYESSADLMKKGIGPILASILQFVAELLIVAVQAFGYYVTGYEFVSGIIVFVICAVLTVVFYRLSVNKVQKLFKEDIGF